ncbi:MAG: carboxylating nicotinate-nucleotide diphosphorylase [Clostridiales bacterium]|jgi:nicotinate-nucleotide pyrophosphorylase (carboxylating)|nr:carboxylating nicotinate-nucleotide diphosphorylase [Clostridiales bacterium]
MLSDVSFLLHIDEQILSALREDAPGYDLSAAVAPPSARGRAALTAKQDGVLAGLPVFRRVFTLLDASFRFDSALADGADVARGQTIGELSGNARALLTGERTALNYLQRLSGVATKTRRFAELLRGRHTRLVDTRKTTPNMRLLEKYAVTVGGGGNHRFCLSDAVMLKDNHLSAAGGVAKAVAAARAAAPFTCRVEVEAETLGQVREALEAGADIIMLDNMNADTMREALALISGRALTECSGGVTEERLLEIAETGCDYVSCGALTHSAGVLDFSIKGLTLC